MLHLLGRLLHLLGGLSGYERDQPLDLLPLLCLLLKVKLLLLDELSLELLQRGRCLPLLCQHLRALALCVCCCLLTFQLGEAGRLTLFGEQLCALLVRRSCSRGTFVLGCNRSGSLILLPFDPFRSPDPREW